MLTVSEMRTRLLADKEKAKSSAAKSSKDTSLFYPVWKMDKGQTATIRFAPDADDENPFFWREKHVINLPFAGVKGNPAAGPTVTVAVPSMSTWSEKDAIVEDIRPLWLENKDLARLFYFRRTYLFRGFVVDSPFAEDNHSRNDVRYFNLTPSIFKQVDATITDPDIENIVCDITAGRDFRVKKGQQGEFARYDMSSFTPKERPLTPEELDSLAAHTETLLTVVGGKPDEARQSMIFDMYQSSRRSEEFDPERFAGFYYRSADTKLAEDFQ